MILLASMPAFADDSGLIWDYRSEDFFKELNERASTDEKQYVEDSQKQLDGRIEKSLEVEFVYTDLEDCINTALENNYNIKTLAAIKKNKEWMYKNSISMLAPDVDYTYSLNKYSGQFLVGGILDARFNEIAFSNTFNVKMPINVGIFFGMSVQKRAKNAATHNLEFTKEETILNTGIAYYDLLEKKLELDVFSKNLRDRGEQLRIAQARHRIGVGAKFDVLRAEAEVAKAKQEYISGYNSIRLYQAKLANILGIDVITPVYPYEYNITTKKLMDDSTEIEALYKIALEQREDVKAKKQEIEAQKAKIKAYWSEFVPTLNLQYQKAVVSTTRIDPKSNDTIGFFVTAPLGKKMGLDTITRIKAEEATLEQMKLNLIVLERNIKENIISSYYTSKNLLEKIDAAKKQIAAADESLKSSIVRLNIGESTFIDVLQAQSEKVMARQSYVVYISQYNKQQIRLLFDTGTISPANVLVNYKPRPPQP